MPVYILFFNVRRNFVLKENKLELIRLPEKYDMIYENLHVTDSWRFIVSSIF
jgi:hypothetical protein